MRRESHSARCKRVSVSQPVQNDALLGTGIGASHTLPAVDMNNIGFHITRLTDIDSSHGKISMSIAALVRMCQVITMLLGNGALTALLTLIPRAIAWPDVLANINILVNVIVPENPSAEQLIIKHGGISLLLKAADQSSKAYLEMKIRTEKNTGEISQGLLSDTFINSSIVRDSVGHESSAKQYVNSTKKFTTCHPEEQEIYSSASITTHSSQHIPENRSVPGILQPIKVDEVETIRTISMENEGIVYGLLKKFYGFTFIEFMDKSDKYTKTEIIQSMLSIFEKIEILLEIISCISLDLSLDDAVEQLVNDASRLVDCELVLFYLVDRETDELI
ncbi:hypothetical protein BSLG_005604 [Batrachochytrium salamandrivorans]|nr:hypothetical protein BSLG_005604 [Batrachochytrium salamandrivorans]